MEHKIKILIVEDEVITSRYLEMGLQKSGYPLVQCATSGEKAIELAEKENPDVVIMDYSLRGNLNGFDAATIIGHFCTPLFIFISAFMELDSNESLEIFKSAVFFPKPILLSDIITIITQWENKLGDNNNPLYPF
jgi:CheY-like chemotaxis protein